MKGWNEPSKYGKANVLGGGLCSKAGEVSSRVREEREREFGHVLDHCVARHVHDLILQQVSEASFKTYSLSKINLPSVVSFVPPSHHHS